MKARLLVREIRGSDDFFVGGQVVPGPGSRPCKEKNWMTETGGLAIENFSQRSPKSSCSTAIPNLAAQLEFKIVLIVTL
jgi:hypothetical protein